LGCPEVKWPPISTTISDTAKRFAKHVDSSASQTCQFADTAAAIGGDHDERLVAGLVHSPGD
jgi:hypothetical protein